MIRNRDGQFVEGLAYSLPQLEAIPAMGGFNCGDGDPGVAVSQVNIDEGNCAACDSAGPGRGACGRCANKGEPS